jgi:hypothetical protein
MLARPGSLRGNQLDVERICDLACNFVLQSQQVADVAVQPLGPQMRISRGIDQLGCDADAAARPADTAF